jgi:hypothetical protein
LLTTKVVVWFEKGPRDWYAKIDRLFINLWFKHYEYDYNIYVLHVHGDTLILVFYVDDLFITSNNPDLILGLKRQLVDSFEMIDLSIFHLFIGIQVLPLLDGVFIFQSKYALDPLKHFKMDDYKSCATPF